MLLPIVECQSASYPLKSPGVPMECLNSAGERVGKLWPVDQACFAIHFGICMPFSPQLGSQNQRQGPPPSAIAIESTLRLASTSAGPPAP